MLDANKCLKDDIVSKAFSGYKINTIFLYIYFYIETLFKNTKTSFPQGFTNEKLFLSVY